MAGGQNDGRRLQSRGWRIVMGAVVALVSQKGGVGKSALARTLARDAAAAGLVVKLADLDVQQGTCLDWSRDRNAAGVEPSVSVESFRSAAAALAIRDKVDLLILDGPARTSQATLEIARVADVVVQPSGPSADDLRPVVRTWRSLSRPASQQSVWRLLSTVSAR